MYEGPFINYVTQNGGEGVWLIVTVCDGGVGWRDVAQNVAN